MIARSRLRKIIFRGGEPVPGNTLRLLQSGTDFFPSLIAAIDAAQAEVHLETYIFNADPTAETVRDALSRAARRGVRVRLLIDGVGSRDFPVAWQDALKAAGVGVLAYRPLVGRWRSNPLSLRRLHRKLAVIDARIAFLGGMNIIDDFEPVRFDAPRLDFSVEVQGPLLARIQAVRVAGQSLTIVESDKATGTLRAEKGMGLATWGEVVGIFIRPPRSGAAVYTVEVVSLKRSQLQITGQDWTTTIISGMKAELGQ